MTAAAERGKWIADSGTIFLNTELASIPAANETMLPILTAINCQHEIGDSHGPSDHWCRAAAAKRKQSGFPSAVLFLFDPFSISPIKRDIK